MDIIRNIFYLSKSYLTIWVLVIHVLYYLGPLRKFQDSLLILSLIVSLGGFVITYIYPKMFKINLKYKRKDVELKITGKIAKLIDLAFHHLPLLLLLILYNPKIKSDNLYLALSIIILYLLINDPFQLYAFNCSNKKNKNTPTKVICSTLITINVLLLGGFFLFMLNSFSGTK